MTAEETPIPPNPERARWWVRFRYVNGVSPWYICPPDEAVKHVACRCETEGRCRREVRLATWGDLHDAQTLAA